MSEELKPCPFCGRPASIDGDWGLEVLSCSDRIGDCPGAVVGMPCHTPQRRAASIAAWNRRAALSVPPGWIPVSERLPPEHVTCALRLRGDYITIGWASYWHGARTDFAQWNFPHDSDEDVAHEITHWMPLPQPPAAPSPKEQT